MKDFAEFLHRPRIVFKQHFPQFGEQQGIEHEERSLEFEECRMMNFSPV
jgi:hypothetical protein